MKITEKEREKIINKEIKSVLVLWILYFLWWSVTGYGFGTDASSYSYIMGLPAWFFLSCIGGYILTVVGVFFIVKFVFKDISLEPLNK